MRITPRPLRALAGGLALLAVAASPAAALEPTFVPDQETIDKAAKKKEDQGWKGRLRIGASLAFSNSSNVVGQQDGNTFTIGLALDAGLDYVLGAHDWRNSLTIAEALTSTPQIDAFVSTTDRLFFESLYSYKALPWLGPFGPFGPFGRFALDTKLLSGFDHRAAPVDYLIAGDDIPKKGKKRLQLTSPFEPLTLKQSVGGFVRPYDAEYARVDLRAGVGFREIFADGGLVVKDDDATPEIEVGRLHDYQLIGAELAAYVQGEVYDKKIAYKVGGEVLFPFLDTAPSSKGKDFADTIDVELGAKISFRIVEWASVDYELKALRQPQLVEEWQIQNNLLLTIGYSLID